MSYFCDVGQDHTPWTVESVASRGTSSQTHESLLLRLRLLVPPPPTIAPITTSNRRGVTENVCAKQRMFALATPNRRLDLRS
ncbi:hypothetical protein Scep_025932 [Stephania cephalantha]|uniref:Uncharacterized protein n=1 Tax=Stephania cephalantha TaxID=152367 RepID=A0AAP0ERE9_9MAGN